MIHGEKDVWTTLYGFLWEAVDAIDGAVEPPQEIE